MALVACSSAPAPETSTPPAETASQAQPSVAPAAQPSKVSDVPASYKDIAFPEFRYVAPVPAEYRVQLTDSVSGYIVSDRSLPLVNFTVYFEESNLPATLKDEAASEMVGSMFRRGGGGGISAHALDDSLEFISAALLTSAGTFLPRSTRNS